MLVCGCLIPENKTYGGGKLKNSPVGDEVQEGLLCRIGTFLTNEGLVGTISCIL